MAALCSCFFGLTFAVFSPQEFITTFTAQQSRLSSWEQKTYARKVYSNISLLAIRYRDDPEQYKTYMELKSYMRDYLDLLSSWSTVISDTHETLWEDFVLSISGIDMEKVRTYWLNLHNQERATKWLDPFVYESSLEKTATTWAQYLARLRRTTHKRSATDGYYSYANIKSWFINQGITFAGVEQGGQALFTENLGRNMYSCKKTDCTQDFIQAIAKTRKFFMSEKKSSYRPHYNAIVGNFTSMGLWVALAGNKYYLVTHYTHPLK